MTTPTSLTGFLALPTYVVIVGLETSAVAKNIRNVESIPQVSMILCLWFRQSIR
jgi:hypothetical protein